MDKTTIFYKFITFYKIDFIFMLLLIKVKYKLFVNYILISCKNSYKNVFISMVTVINYKNHVLLCFVNKMWPIKNVILVAITKHFNHSK